MQSQSQTQQTEVSLAAPSMYFLYTVAPMFVFPSRSNSVPPSLSQASATVVVQSGFLKIGIRLSVQLGDPPVFHQFSHVSKCQQVRQPTYMPHTSNMTAIPANQILPNLYDGTFSVQQAHFLNEWNPCQHFPRHSFQHAQKFGKILSVFFCPR